jgi:hypothetical protein
MAPLALPLLEDVAGEHCMDINPVIGYVAQDLTNLYWSGKVYASTQCPDEGNAVHEGCVLARWDPTGTTYTVIQVIYRLKMGLDQRNRKIGLSDCLAPEIPTMS